MPGRDPTAQDSSSMLKKKVNANFNFCPVKYNGQTLKWRAMSVEQ